MSLLGNEKRDVGSKTFYDTSSNLPFLQTYRQLV